MRSDRSLESGPTVPDLPERIIADRYTELEPLERGPRAFWSITVAKLPVLRTTSKPPTRSWADVRAFLARPQYYGLKRRTLGENSETRNFRDAARIATIALALIGEHDRCTSASNGVDGAELQFCAYCWRLGFAPERLTGFKQPKRIERDLPRHVEQSLASPIRCSLHRTEWSRTGKQQSNVVALRHERAREKELDRRERELIEADRKAHAPGLRFPIRGSSIIKSSDRSESEWEYFVRKTFSFAAYHKQFEGICESPKKAFDVLDKGNKYSGREEVHKELRRNPTLLAFFLMPMMLRADVCVEHDERAKLKKAHRAKLKRWEASGRKGQRPRFKMPSRAEWAELKELEAQPKPRPLSPGRRKATKHSIDKGAPQTPPAAP